MNSPMNLTSLPRYKPSVEEMKEAKQKEGELWLEYVTTIHPDYQIYMPFQNWLALKVAELSDKQ